MSLFELAAEIFNHYFSETTPSEEVKIVMTPYAAELLSNNIELFKPDAMFKSTPAPRPQIELFQEFNSLNDVIDLIATATNGSFTVYSNSSLTSSFTFDKREKFDDFDPRLFFLFIVLAIYCEDDSKSDLIDDIRASRSIRALCTKLERASSQPFWCFGKVVFDKEFSKRLRKTGKYRPMCSKRTRILLSTAI